jgi:hypothetical protein
MVLLAALLSGCEVDNGGGWNEPLIPVSLKGIQTVNIDNSGEFPKISAAPIKKEAYVVGVKWIADDLPSDDDEYITDPVRWGEQQYGMVADHYERSVVCLTPFNADIPAGSNVSKYFKKINYLPEDVDEGFALLVAPDPGVHRFRMEYYYAGELEFSHETTAIEFF